MFEAIAIGVLLAIAFGCLVAAYDLRGGVPRSLWPIARVLFVGALVCVLTGTIGWILSWPAGERGRVALRAVLVLAGLAIASGAALWFHDSSRWTSSRLGLGPLFPVIDPHSSCLQLLRELRELSESGTCPTFVMDDVPCRCGAERWEPGKTAKCATGPTACQYRETAQTIGCAEHGSTYTLEEARRALADRDR